MMRKLTLESATFYVLLFLWLLPIWSVSVVLTGDGPCHLYNSRILLDFLQGNNRDMYDHFLTLNKYVNPNWLTNAVQVPLVAVFSPVIAEKIFFTLYVFGFAFGLRFLIRQINPKALYLCSIGLLFAWHHIVFKGFFNYTLSIAVWFWAVGCWLKYRNAGFGKAVGLQMIMALVGYFSHPVGFAFTIMMIACLLISETVAIRYESSTGKKARDFFLKQILRLFVAYMPALILVVIFITRRTWVPEAAGYNSEVWKNFITMPALVVLNSREETFAVITSLLCFLLFGISLFLRIKEKKIRRDDGFLLFVVLSFLLIIFPPASIMGGFDVPRRLIMLPLLAILFFVATRNAGQVLRRITLVAGCGITIAFLMIRLPVQKDSAAFAQEIISCNDKIEPRSTVMTLNYDLNPHSLKGESVVDMEWTNVHTDGYLGVNKPLILADNYELNSDYFPFIGIGETSFYPHSGKDGATFEGLMPRVDIDRYRKETGIDIDYIILYGMNEEQRKHEFTLEVMDQLDKGYKKIYTSPHGTAILYKSRSGYRNPWKTATSVP